MLKQFLTLVRGRGNDAAERIVDANALTILRQQIRDCAEATAAARRAVAVAIAQNDTEMRRGAALSQRIADIEERAVAALAQGKDELAREAAEAIAAMEGERQACEAAQKGFEAEIARLKAVIRDAGMRLRDLQRGQRLAAATDATQRLRETAPSSTLSALRDAEETLARLRSRQAERDAATTAVIEMEMTGDPAALRDRLAAAGCGAPLPHQADAVLARLRQRAGIQP